MKKILIVEDETIIAQDIQYCLEDAGYQVLGIVDNADAALAQIRKEKPDLVLLDINLNKALDGVQIAALINQDFKIPFIFITAFIDKASRDRAKKTEPYAYLIKPFNDIELEIAVELALDRFDKERAQSQESAQREDQVSLNEELNAIFIKTPQQNYLKIDIEEIAWIEAYDIYSYIHIAGTRHLVSATLKDLSIKINAPALLRIHRSYIINLNKIEALNGNRVIIDKREIPIGRSYKEILLEKLRFI
jgi:DNA-binding LytR/AlgR family response regulator